MNPEEIWQLADRNNDGWMDFSEFTRILKKINIDMTPNEAKRLHRDKLDKHGFLELFGQLSKRSDLKRLYASLSNNDSMDREYYLAFLQIQQAQPTEMTSLSFEAFCEWFEQPENSILNPQTHDMSQPLMQYFINASHNSYLTSDQLAGSSSTEQYKKILLGGGRCVEIDVWDGPQEPIVYHGHTMTSKILFRDVIQTIHDFSFETSPYPVCISIENHCSEKQQQMMAQIMREILQDYLLTAEPSLGSLRMPSPEELKHKILVKGKRLEEDDELPEDAVEPPKKVVQKKENFKMSRELSDLAVYFQSHKFKDLDEVLLDQRSFMHVSSFGESKALRMCKTTPDKLTRYNNHAFSRIYPAGRRVDSSNYNPAPYWGCGCQLVALNFQTFDQAMLMNLLMFAQNQNMGYVLRNNLKTCLVVSCAVISAFNLPKPRNNTKGEIIDPYVEVELVTPKEREKWTTPIIDNNGFNPVWSKDPKPHESLKTFKITVESPEASFLIFTIKDKDLMTRDEFIASGGVCLSAMQQGYRHVPLYDYQMKILTESRLFVCVSSAKAQ
ncbi:PLC-like phosphodiesterase, partial [Gorgonomyces haynaldii]